MDYVLKPGQEKAQQIPLLTCYLFDVEFVTQHPCSSFPVHAAAHLLSQLSHNLEHQLNVWLKSLFIKKYLQTDRLK